MLETQRQEVCFLGGELQVGRVNFQAHPPLLNGRPLLLGGKGKEETGTRHPWRLIELQARYAGTVESVDELQMPDMLERWSLWTSCKPDMLERWSS